MCRVCEQFEAREAAASLLCSHGAVAQLVEHHDGIVGVARSSRVSSTLGSFLALVQGAGFLLGGLVAGEGSFVVSRLRLVRADGSPRLRFIFCVTLASRDRALLAALRTFLGTGSIQDRQPPKDHWQPTSEFRVSSHRAHRAVTIPFAEHFLLPSARRMQFEQWRDALGAYEKTGLAGEDAPSAPRRDATSQSGAAVCADPTTTVSPDIDALALFAAGVVAGEGCFTRTQSGGHPRFMFEVGMGATDTHLCGFLRDLLGVGRLHFSPRRRPHYDDEITYVVGRLRDLVEVVIPFMDGHLPPSYKRVQ